MSWVVAPPRSGGRLAVRVLDVEVDRVRMGEAVELVEEAIDARRGHGGPVFHVATVNPEFVMLARRHPVFRQVLRRCSLRTADGAGLMLAARILGHRLPERVTGVDLVRGICQAAARRLDRVFLLGGGPGVADAAAQALVRDYPGLIVAGTFAGVAGEQGDPATLAAIRAGRPDIILVAYGAPSQELWADRNLAVSGASVALGVGGTFDYLSGRVRRAPAWMRRLGLEWAFRLLRQPTRMRRMAVLPGFLLLVIRQRLTGR